MFPAEQILTATRTEKGVPDVVVSPAKWASVDILLTARYIGYGNASSFDVRSLRLVLRCPGRLIYNRVFDKGVMNLLPLWKLCSAIDAMNCIRGWYCLLTVRTYR